MRFLKYIFYVAAHAPVTNTNSVVKNNGEKCIYKKKRQIEITLSKTTVSKIALSKITQTNILARKNNDRFKYCCQK